MSALSFAENQLAVVHTKLSAPWLEIEAVIVNVLEGGALHVVSYDKESPDKQGYAIILAPGSWSKIVFKAMPGGR